MSERRQNILQQKQTDSLPTLASELPNAKFAWRQLIQVREENRRLSFELDDTQLEAQQLQDNYQRLKDEFDKEISILHDTHQQELAVSQATVQQLLEERLQIQMTNAELTQRYQELANRFEQGVEEEALKMLSEASQTMILSPDKTSVLFQDIVKTVELQVRQVEDKHLVETLFVKRELLRIAQQLERERQELNAERLQVFAWQHSVREQATERQKLLHQRLSARWRVASISTAAGLLLLLVVCQFVFLSLFHVQIVATISLAILAPLLLCIVLAVVFSTPIKMLRYMINSVPRRKKLA